MPLSWFADRVSIFIHLYRYNITYKNPLSVQIGGFLCVSLVFETVMQSTELNALLNCRLTEGEMHMFRRRKGSAFAFGCMS